MLDFINTILNLVKQFIELCNDNSGFISAILATATIIITIMIAVMPYRKKLSFYHFLDADKNADIVMTLYISNSGNYPVYIDEITVKDGYRKIIATYSTGMLAQDKILMPHDTKEFQITFEGCKCTGGHTSKYLRIIVTAGKKQFKYRTNWAMG